jgi:hypothetical protein
MSASDYTYRQIVKERVNLKRIATKTASEEHMIPLFGEWIIRVHESGATLVLPYQLPDGQKKEVSGAL